MALPGKGRFRGLGFRVYISEVRIQLANSVTLEAKPNTSAYHSSECYSTTLRSVPVPGKQKPIGARHLNNKTEDNHALCHVSQEPDNPNP